MLDFPKTNSLGEKKSGKKNMIYLYSILYLKIVFILLIKVVAIYIELFLISLQKSSFK